MKPKIRLEYDSTLQTWKATLLSKRVGRDSLAQVHDPSYFEIGATKHEALGKLLESYSGELGIEVWVK